MNRFLINRFLTLVVATGLGVLVAQTPPSWGQQPPDLTSSDSSGNTAGGSNALLDLQTDGGSIHGDSTAFGFAALQNNTTGAHNTACGAFALGSNLTGSNNTATGETALLLNTTGADNTAIGTETLYWSGTGSGNTASGYAALFFNNASYNTATGMNALYFNGSGANGTGANYNTATGMNALYSNSSGADNAANGFAALYSNTTGSQNSADGFEALNQSTTASYNTATGSLAMKLNTTGFSNTAAGELTLYNNTSGSGNIAIGYAAGFQLTTGNNNIDIGNSGVAAESGKIRIGTKGTQTATFIAGISGVDVTGGAPVEVTSAGQLGIVMSSARYKHDIRDMGDKSSALLKLRPVTFRYNNDPANTLQYGLVAEEVAKVYPELVVYGPDGKVMTVRYSMLSAMLLNELQKQAVEVRKQNRENQRLAAQVSNLSAQMVAMRLSNEHEAASLKANYQRGLQSIQERLAAMEQSLDKTNGHKLADAFER